MTFNEKLAQSPAWQIDRYNDLILKSEINHKDLTDSEKRSLLWLAGFEQETCNNIVSAMGKRG